MPVVTTVGTELVAEFGEHPCQMVAKEEVEVVVLSKPKNKKYHLEANK